MLKVIAIRETADGNRTQREWLRGIETPAEATAAIGQMLGQDDIVDGYWIGEDEPLYAVAESAKEDAARIEAFHAAMAVPSPIFGVGLTM